MVVTFVVEMKDMRSNKTFKTVLSILLGLAILMGSTGFVLVSHECQHTGAKTYVISGNNGTETTCCEHEISSCCSESPGNESCAFTVWGEEPCCEHESATIQLPGFTITDKSVEDEKPFLSEIHEHYIVPLVYHTNNLISNFYPDKLPGKKKLLINCQFLA